MHINELPDDLRPVANSLIKHAINGTKASEDTDKLAEWFQVERWDELISSWSDDDVALNLHWLAQLKFDDAELRDYEDLDGPLTDTNRIDFARNVINQAFDEMYGVECPSIHTVMISNEEGEQAILGWTVEIHGQGGPVCFFAGSFREKRHFIEHLHDMNYYFRSEINMLTDEKLLSLWEYS